MLDQCKLRYKAVTIGPLETTFTCSVFKLSLIIKENQQSKGKKYIKNIPAVSKTNPLSQTVWCAQRNLQAHVTCRYTSLTFWPADHHCLLWDVMPGLHLFCTPQLSYSTRFHALTLLWCMQSKFHKQIAWFPYQPHLWQTPACTVYCWYACATLPAHASVWV